jgi:radical SAM/Cys-rich protein
MGSEQPAATTPSFSDTLRAHGLALHRDVTDTLQVNVGRLCNLACRHCHLEAAPGCPEVMTRETMSAVIDYARRARFEAIDLTGGAPELAPNIEVLVAGLAPLASRLLFRTNLTAMHDHARDALPTLLKEHRVVVVASLPSLDPGQAAAQRGAGTLDKSLAMLRVLNALGYGREGSGLVLNLVANPSGAFLPAAQRQHEAKLRGDLARRHGIVFNELHALANVPLGRFRRWLEASGNLAQYLDKLSSSFNPATVAHLMCRRQISVGWDGHVYDCDFNLASGLGHGGRRVHVSSMPGRPPAGVPIVTGEHCFACTAGSGSSCGGALAA